MDIKLIVALIGLIGVISSAIVQFILGRRSERIKKTNEIRTQAYLDLINAVSDIASMSKIQDSEISLTQLKYLISSKSRVVLIGSKDVVIEVHQFFTIYNKLESDASFNDFSKIVAAMRNDLTGKSDLDSRLLIEALFGKE